MTDAIKEFIGENRFLSNFYLVPVAYEGTVYRSVEHAFQSLKTLVTAERHHINWSDEFSRPTTPGEAKKAGGPYAERPITLRPDWEDIKLSLMMDLLRIKFTNIYLAEKLLATGDAELVEGNHWKDRFWGVCRGTGENWLGILLMQLRKELCANK